MTSDSSSPTESAAAVTGDNSSSHRSSLPSPWAQVVCGGAESDSVAPTSEQLTEQNVVVPDQLTISVPQTAADTANTSATVESNAESSEGSNNGNASGVRMSVWNKPLANGVPEGSGSPVMGAASWPALSELNRLSKSESLSKSTSDGSVTVSQAPAIPQLPQKPDKTNQNPTQPVRQRSNKRGGGGAGGGYSRPPPPPPPPMPPYPLFDMSYGGFVPAVLDPQVREQSPYNGNNFAPRPMGGVGSHSFPVQDHSSNRKRNNFGPRPRGDGGPYVNNGHGGRRDHHDRDWRGPRSHGAMPHQVAPPPPPPPRGYMQQAHLGPAPFIAPQPIRLYGAPMGYEMAPQPPPPPPLPPFVYVPTLPPPESYRGPLHPRAPPPAIFVPVIDPLSASILHQIEYYFSDDNLAKDGFLRSKMDEEGWVPITLIAGFRRVKNLTSNTQTILKALTFSTAVEVQGETVRKRNDWRKWLSLPTNFPTDSSSQSPLAATDGSVLETSIQELTLDESTPLENKDGPSDIYCVGLTDSLNPPNGEVTTGHQSMNPKSSTS